MLRQPMTTSGIAIVVQSYITKVTNKAMNNDDVPETNDRETNLAMMLIFINCESVAIELEGFIQGFFCKAVFDPQSNTSIIESRHKCR